MQLPCTSWVKYACTILQSHIFQKEYQKKETYWENQGHLGPHKDFSDIPDNKQIPHLYLSWWYSWCVHSRPPLSRCFWEPHPYFGRYDYRVSEALWWASYLSQILRQSKEEKLSFNKHIVMQLFFYLGQLNIFMSQLECVWFHGIFCDRI